MSDWTTVRLSEVAEIRVSNVDKKTVPGEPRVLLCNYMDVYANDYVTDDLPFMEATAPAAQVARFKVEAGDVMITKDSETPDDIGIPAVAVADVETLVCGYHLALLKPRKDAIDGTYLAKQLGTRETARYFGQRASGSTRYGLSNGTIARTPIRLAPLAQQQRIAEILSTVDEAIEQTEALVGKWQQMKTGLMHDLFTRGVTPEGHLRPTRIQAPQLYKESPVGWIPKEWDCLTVNELLAKTFSPMRSGPFGSSLLKDELVEEGVPFLGIDNIFVERFARIFRRFVSRQKFAELIRYSVFPGDVIITIMGTVGRCCVVPEFVTEALSSKHLWTMTFDTCRIFPELACWQLNHARWVRDWFARYSQGAVMEAIQSSTLRNLRLPIPKIGEQKLILDRYRECCLRIEREEAAVAKLRQQKQGLMHDLLTGRVRVSTE